jgi:WXG100 family type VII secretion target
MGTDVIQANYDELENVAARFGQWAENNSDITSRVQQCAEKLINGDWIGQGVEAFAAELNGEVFPAMQRLTQALEQVRSVTLEVKFIVQQAEEEAASLFRNGGAGVEGAHRAANLGDTLDLPIPETVTTPRGTFDNRRELYIFSPPQEVKNHPFRSGAATALKYDVTIGNRTIPVYIPKNSKAVKGKIHSIEQVAKGLAALPEHTRQLVTQVNINPGQNPKDAFWAKKYKRPKFRSYMTAGAAGIIDLYPTAHKQSQDILDGSLIHETGHIWSRQNWGKDGDARWNDWKAAMSSDNSRASKYAKSSPGEDFSETLQLYHQVKGTHQEAVVRKRMPERFKLIDEIVAGKR